VETSLIAALLLGLFYRVRLRLSTVLLGSTLIVALGIYLSTRYIHPVSNYQYFKTIASLAPAAGLGFGMALGEALTRHEVPAADPPRRVRRESPTALWAATIVVTAAVCVAAMTFVVDFRRSGSVVPTSYESLVGSPRAQMIFDRYNVVAPFDLSTFALGAEVDFNWIGRYQGRPPTRLRTRLDHPVALLVPESTCPGFMCLAGVDPEAVVLKEGGVALVQLSADSRALADRRQGEWLPWISASFHALGGRGLPELTPSPTSAD
jgi:hypothetical protein